MPPHKNNTKSRIARTFSLLMRAALPAAILAAGWAAYSILSVPVEEDESPPVEDQAVRTKVIELQVEDYPVVIRTHGIVQAHNQIVLNAQVGGKITYVSPNFEAGAHFTTGDVLLEIEAKDYDIALALAKARHQGAQSAVQLAKLSEERLLKLVETNAVSKAEVDSATAARAQAEADMESTAAQMDQAQLDLQRTKIYAPFDGRVRQRDVGLGQTVGPQTPLGDLFAVDFAEVRLPLSGRELQFLTLPEFAGDPPLEVELRDAINEDADTTWTARIVRTDGVLDENSKEIYAIARIDDPFGRNADHAPLRIGQPVLASIDGKVLTDVVALPRAAVRQLDQVNLVDKSQLTLIPKTIVPIWSDEDYVVVRDPEIREMFLATTRLVYAPHGTKVEIIPDAQPASGVATSVPTTHSKPVAN